MYSSSGLRSENKIRQCGSRAAAVVKPLLHFRKSPPQRLQTADADELFFSANVYI